MKKYACMLILLLTVGTLAAQDKTLRVDYFFTGNAERQEIWVDELSVLPGWSGRKHNLAQLPLTGYGQITVRDLEKGTVIYRTSFSTLFQEWLETDEARKVQKGFENTFLLPYPKQPALSQATGRSGSNPPRQTPETESQHEAYGRSCRHPDPSERIQRRDTP